MGVQVDLNTLEHRDGVPWYESPKPRKFRHHHAWQTRCWVTEGYWVYRCACGSTHYSDIPGWEEERQPRWRNKRSDNE